MTQRPLSDYDKRLLEEWERQESEVSLISPNYDRLPHLYLPRLLTSSILPRRRTKDTEVVRENRDLRFVVRTIDGSPLPYGAIARKLLLFFATRSCLERSRRVVVGKSENELLETLGIAKTGSIHRRLRAQIRSLAALSVEIDFKPNEKQQVIYRGVVFSHIWLTRDENQLPMWASEIEFSRDFYDVVCRRYNPYPREQIASLSSAFSLDVFLWLANRLPEITPSKPSFITLHQLYSQFAFSSSSGNLYNFEKCFLKALKSVGSVWKNLDSYAHYCRKSKMIKLESHPELVERKSLAK